jgi:YHS domain-containing protein
VTDSRPKLPTLRLRARGEEYRIVQLQGQLFVCTRQNGSCCWRVLSPPETLHEHAYERYVPLPGATLLPVMDEVEETDGLERIDPVCLMDVDPATARHTAECGGRRIVFCAPACRKLFLANPLAYLSA